MICDKIIENPILSMICNSNQKKTKHELQNTEMHISLHEHVFYFDLFRMRITDF